MEMLAVRAEIGKWYYRVTSTLGEKEHSSRDTKGRPQLLNIYTTEITTTRSESGRARDCLMPAAVLIGQTSLLEY